MKNIFLKNNPKNNPLEGKPTNKSPNNSTSNQTTNSTNKTSDTFNILYIYDLHATNKKKFNRTKRLFYYHLGRLPLKKEGWKTKSAFVVQPKMETMVDAFFKRFGRAITVYKAVVDSIEELES